MDLSNSECYSTDVYCPAFGVCIGQLPVALISFHVAGICLISKKTLFPKHFSGINLKSTNKQVSACTSDVFFFFVKKRKLKLKMTHENVMRSCMNELTRNWKQKIKNNNISYLHRNINNHRQRQNHRVFVSYFSLCWFPSCTVDNNRNLLNTTPAATGVHVNNPDSPDAMLSDSLAIFDKLYCNSRINTTLPIQLADVHYATVVNERDFLVLNSCFGK